MQGMKESKIPYIGLIPKSWCIDRIKHIVSTPVCTGAGEEAQLYKPDSIRYIRISDFDKNGRIIGENARYIAANKAENYILSKGDILVATAGATVGKTLLFEGLEETACFAGFLARIRTDENKMFNRYLMYQMTCMIMDGFRSYYVKKSTIENISASAYSNMPIVLAPIDSQKKIVNYLDRKCSVIDNIIAKQEQIIEKLKEYKISVITEAVIKGIDKNAEMKDSGVEWIGKTPASWKVYKIANLYEQTSEQGQEDLPILTVSINSGISDRELDDDEQDRIFVRSEDRTKYKRVRPGDLAYNMMRAWQGAFGAARVDGMVSPAYVTCRPKKGVKIDTRFIEYLLRTPIATEEMHRYSHGIADFRLRLYWPEFRNIQVCLPSYSEQVIIADYLDKKVNVIDNNIFERNKVIEKHQVYKKSLIYEVVTGKKEV